LTNFSREGELGREEEGVLDFMLGEKTGSKEEQRSKKAKNSFWGGGMNDIV